MLQINEQALLSATMGVLGIYYATGKQPPEWLVLTSLVTGIIGTSLAISDIINESEINTMGQISPCQCRQLKEGLL